MPTLNWLTRDQDIQAASRAPYRLLEEASDLSAGDKETGNMLVQGDNLEALKALLPFYGGRVIFRPSNRSPNCPPHRLWIPVNPSFLSRD